MNRNDGSRTDEYEQFELEHAPMMQPSDEILNKGFQSRSVRPLSPEHDDFGQKSSSKKSTSRWGVLARTSILLPPVAVSLAILALNFRNVFWGLPTTKTNTILSALQFAAQVHASLLVASISMMVLNLIQHGLVNGRGVPLGMISANFYVDSPTWLFRTEFTSLSLKYTLIFPWIVFLAVLSAPSSAIVLLPRLQFWSVDNVWLGKDNIKFGVYIESSPGSLYPEVLTAEMSAPQCAGKNASTLPECPSYGMRQFMLDQELFSFPAPSSINITMPGKWNRFLVGHVGTVMQGSSSSYVTSSLSTFLGDAMLGYHDALSSFNPQGIGSFEGKGAMQYEENDLRARYDLSFQVDGEKFPTRKPFVESQCHGLPANSSSLTLPHDRMLAGGWGSEPIASTAWTVPYSAYSNLSGDLNSTMVNSSLIAGDAEYFGEIRPSMAAIFATPEIMHSGTYLESTEPWSFFACTFNARWMETETHLEIARPESTVYDSSPDPEVPGYLDPDQTKDLPAMPAYIGDSWANLLNVPYIDSLATPVPGNRTILDAIGEACLEKHTFLNATFLRQKTVGDGKLYYVSTESMALSTCLQVSLSAYLTDALSRAHNTVPIYIDVEGRVDDPYTSYYPKDVSMSQGLYEDAQLLSSGSDRAKYHANLTAADFQDATRFTEIRMKMSRYGYGYGFQDSILIYVGTVVLLLHATMSVVYIIWVVSMAKHLDTDDRTVGKLLVLGMQSGSLGASSDAVAVAGDEKEAKTMWKTRFGLKYVETEAGSDSGGICDAHKTQTAILQKI
ncbi:hypothetical protein DL98DRAFT_525846 [Cadophora sp. DSE1049]|nr:hypothetical protein DL98DRAFT_525846 [Cadophora sp. DSE1049]